jgi:hypothetical protein
MPLLDHFHPPLSPHHRWESFYSNWATRIADAIDAILPPEFQVEEHTHAGPGFEIDVATYEGESAPPMPDRPMPATFPDTFEVRVFSTASGLTLVAVIERVSPGNKDRPAERRAFAAKCASYLAQGVSLIVVDVVTSRHVNLHNDVMRLMEAAPDLDFPDGLNLYAVAYRPVRRGEQEETDLWMRSLSVGEPWRCCRCA